MPINASHEYFEAERRYLQAQTLVEKIKCLEELIRAAPKHKGSENLLAELRLRLKKFREKQEKSKKSGKGKKGIKKEGYQIALIGKTNSGKSSLLAKLTNAHPKISNHDFTTKEPELGTMNFQGVKAQVVDLPSAGSKDFDFNIPHSADCILLIVEKIEDINEAEKVLERTKCNKIIVVNKIDKVNDNEKRKLDQRCRAKRLKDYVLVSSETGEGIAELKNKILGKMRIIRVFMKEPGKEKSEIPVVLKEGSIIKDVAESIYKGFSKQVKETRLTGPSGKFTNQRVGMKHVCKDMDVVEFRD